MPATRYVALLRGVNVGGRATVPMAALRELLQHAGCTEPRTHGNRGNAVFTSTTAAAGLAAALAAALERRFGRPIAVLLRTAAELCQVLADSPLQPPIEVPSRYTVTFLATPVAPDVVDAVEPRYRAEEQFWCPRGSEIFTYSPTTPVQRRLPISYWERRGAGAATARNWNTVTALARLADG